MNGIWGNKLGLSLFGESHGTAIGITIHGLPSGVVLDLDEIDRQMARRRPGQGKLTTSRGETDQVEIVSGFFEGKTTGTPLTGIIRNRDTRSEDYEDVRNRLRPGHGDYPGKIRYSGHEDFRGGGHFSGRLTAPLVFAGAVAAQWLAGRGVRIGAHIQEMGGVQGGSFLQEPANDAVLDRLRQMTWPVLDKESWSRMEEAVLQARQDMDSVGGIVECAVLHLPPGLGDPFFHSVESRLSQLLYSIPAIKALAFGSGFELARMRGSEANDPYRMQDGAVVTTSNHNGGITGGITNGMPVIFRVAVKPTPSIGKPQDTIDYATMKDTQLEIRGRHDPCIVPRVVPVVESCAALAMMDLML